MRPTIKMATEMMQTLASVRVTQEVALSVSGCWIEGLISLLAIGWRPPSGPAAAHNVAVVLTQNEWASARINVPKMEATDLLVTCSHHHCLILFSRGKSLNLAHIQAFRIIQGCEYQEVESLATILETAYYIQDGLSNEMTSEQKSKGSEGTSMAIQEKSILGRGNSQCKA